MGDLGRELGVSQQQIYKYECGVNAMRPSMLWRVSVVLDVSMDYFFEGIED